MSAASADITQLIYSVALWKTQKFCQKRKRLLSNIFCVLEFVCDDEASANSKVQGRRGEPVGDYDTRLVLSRVP